jgi:hypothetical protein
MFDTLGLIEIICCDHLGGGNILQVNYPEADLEYVSPRYYLALGLYERGRNGQLLKESKTPLMLDSSLAERKLSRGSLWIV